jgi:hypothetical protein
MKADMVVFNWRGCGEIKEGHKSLLHNDVQMLKVDTLMDDVL